MARDNNAKRPLLISIIGYLYVLGALLFLLAGIMFALGMGDGTFVLEGTPMDISGYQTFAGGSMVVTAIVFFLVAKAFLDGWTIAWYLGVILQALGLVAGIIMFPIGLVSTVICAIVLYYLFRPDVKAFFNV
ncbi:MAG: hypothetical protein AB7E27_03945 [Candidatus Methanomethylophilaceae archaeon]|jgi:hypothetical protein